jgi:16S rRNA processing protein RimM
MKKEECFLFGKIIKAHGYKGELIVSVLFVIPDISAKTEFIFVELDGLLVPFFFETCQGQGNSLNIKFEDVDNDEESSRLCGCNLWLPSELLPPASRKLEEISNFSGFSVKDKIKGNIGILREVIEMPQQQMLCIIHNSKEILIPVAEEIIVRIDKKNKTIHIDAPDGLIDMYLDG